MKEQRILCLAMAVAALTSCSAGSSRRVAAQRSLPPDPPIELPLSTLAVFPRPPKPRPPDAIDTLIHQAEEQYESGIAEYGAGNFDKARVAFDRALGILLESNMDVLAEERLKNEFDKLVENIHSLEVVTVERGDVLSEKKYDPAPIEAFSGLTFPVDPNVSKHVQEEIKTVRSDLPLVSNDIVNGVIAYLQGRGSGFIKTALKRMGQYQSLFSDELKKEGMPQDLVYLAAAESAFNPFALSRAGAKGIWQLMPGRASEYGLRKDRWVDEREDPEKSTQAAVRHLKDLYETFGDWYLAMAAYNCGPVSVQKAIEKTGYADFWTLHRLHALPAETENYVPIILAMALIAKDPKAYGIEVESDTPIETDQVAVAAPTDLRLIAQLIDRPVEDLIRLNPGLLRWTTPANDPEYTLRLPKGTRPVFEEAVAAIPLDKRIWWRAHKVAEGDTLSSVAHKFRIAPVTLANANNLDPGDSLAEGQRLVLPMAPGSESSLARVRERGPRRPITYKVKPGDTLDRIADRFDVTPYQIRKWNRLSGSQLSAGKNLRIYAATGRTSGAQKSRRRSSSSAAHGRKTSSSPTRAAHKPAPPRKGGNAPAPTTQASR